MTRYLLPATHHPRLTAGTTTLQWSVAERSIKLDTRQTILGNFAACPLCGCFLTSLLALLDDESLDRAIERGQGSWLEFPWQPPMAEMLTAYYDWRLEPDTEGYSRSCPSCLRRVIYQRADQIASLQIERRPGSRV